MIPLIINNILNGKPLPVYGEGKTYETGFMSTTMPAEFSRLCETEYPARFITLADIANSRTSI